MAGAAFDHVTKVFGEGAVALDDLHLEIADGELLVIVGPSGCGKSTALRILAGLESPSEGRVLIGGEDVTGRTPQERNVAMVFQSYALYPHKTVRGNMEFPLRMMGMASEARRRRIEETARILGLEEQLDRKPRELSGGQAQRAAMGRALVREPRLSLLDEPLSNLDAKLRVEIRAELAELQRETGLTTVYVTHDQVEAMTLGHRVAVLHRGRLQQCAPPQEVYDRPANVFVATFIGSPRMNLLRARLRRDEDQWALELGDRSLPFRPERVEGTEGLEARAGEPVVVGLRPEDVRPAGEVEKRYRVQGTVETAEALGHERIVYLRTPLEVHPPEGTRHRDEKEEWEDAGHGSAREPDDPPLVARLPPGEAPEAGARLEVGLELDRAHLFTTEGERL
jgi:multiple sugar transport system ATP-binding protein